MRDFLPCPQSRYKVQRQWVLQRDDREKALAKRAVKNMERLAVGTRALAPLEVGDHVSVQIRLETIHPDGILRVLWLRKRTLISMLSELMVLVD